MKTLRTFGIIVAVALAAIGLAVVPSVDEMPEARPGIAVGDTADPGSAAASDTGADPAGQASGDGEAVALPAPTASEQPVRGVHTDTGVGTMEAEPSPEPPPAPESAPAAQQPRSSGGSSGSSSSSSGGSSSSSGGGESTAPRPSGVCEWDDGERECDDDDDDDDDDDADDDDDDDDDD